MLTCCCHNIRTKLTIYHCSLLLLLLISTCSITITQYRITNKIAPLTFHISSSTSQGYSFFPRYDYEYDYIIRRGCFSSQRACSRQVSYNQYCPFTDYLFTNLSPRILVAALNTTCNVRPTTSCSFSVSVILIKRLRFLD